MKSYAPLLILAILLSFGSGYYALFIQEDPIVTEDDINRIRFLKENFFRTHSPDLTINLNEVYSKPTQRELYKPTDIFSSSYDFANSIYSTSKDCFKHINGMINFSSFEKAYIWEEFRCGKRKGLAKNFVYKPPYLHPSGVSYAYLVFLASNKSRPTDKALLNILPFFHIGELHNVQKGLGKLPRYFSYLADLEDESASHLINGKKIVLTRNYLFFRASSFFNMYENVYKIYDRQKLERYIQRSNYQIKINQHDRTCFYRDDGICWDYNLRKILSLTSKPKLIVLGMSIIILILVLWQIFTKLKAQKFEDDRRRLALQVLTHEFRTPITSLLLSMENIYKNFDKIDENLQEDLLRVSSDIHRLQRLTEMSRNYLKSDNQKQLVNINKQTVPSINDFIESVAEPYWDQIKLTLPEQDQAFCIDEYWLGICLKNLIENALFHGGGNVEVKVSINKDKLIVDVSDAGVCTFDSLEELTKPFVKGNKSSGTGLGLNIVKNVVEAMGGTLSFNKSPTTFSIGLKGAV